MMDEANSAPDVESLLECLAVVERATATILAALMDAAVPDALWRDLSQQPGVTQDQGHLVLAPALVEQRLAALGRSDGDRFRRLHHQALNTLAKQLYAGDTGQEATLFNIFKRLADHLLAERGVGNFQALVASAQQWPCTLAGNMRWLHYYQGASELEQGNYAVALESFDALLAQEFEDPHLRGRVLNARAYCYRVRGQLEDALQGYQASLAIWRACGDEIGEGKCLLNMGTSAYYLQDYTAAEPWLHAAAAIFAKHNMPVLLGAAQNGMGLIRRDQGRWDEAINHFQSFIDLSQARGASDSVSIGLLNIGEVLLFQGRSAEAIQTLRQSLASMERRLYAIDVHIHLALAYWASDQIDQAQEAMQQAADLAHSLDRKEILPHIEYWLAVLARERGETWAVEAHLLQAVQIVEQTRIPMANEGLKISLLGRWQQIYEALVLHYVDLQQPEEAFQWAERARARAFAEALLNRKRMQLPDAEYQSVTVTELQRAMAADLRLLCYFTTGVLASDIPMLSAIPAQNPLRKHLLVSARTLCFAIGKEALSVHACPINPNLFTMVSPRGYDVNRWLDASVLAHLRNTLLMESATDPECARYTIVPHGPLHLVPFVALQPDAMRSATTGPTITYVPNATVFWHSLSDHSSDSAATSALAVGYNGLRQGKQLRYTEVEVESVAALLAGEAMVGGDAKKEQLRQIVQDKAWLHFACHAWFDHELPLESYLQTGEDERLTALEVMEGWRLRAQLVTLSACQTGVSRVLRGDEPMGLIRSFLSAGAKAVLVTQWPVEDLPTCLLMIRFYQKVTAAARADLSYGLLTAQRWLCTLTAAEARDFAVRFGIKLTEDEVLLTLPHHIQPFQHPRFWAAFKLVVGS